MYSAGFSLVFNRIPECGHVNGPEVAGVVWLGLFGMTAASATSFRSITDERHLKNKMLNVILTEMFLLPFRRPWVAVSVFGLSFVSRAKLL